MENLISRSDFITVVNDIFSPDLEKLGYRFIQDPKIYDESTDVWYVQYSEADKMYRIIDIQTGGYTNEALFEMAINLCRWTSLWGENAGDYYPRQFSFVRFAPIIWDAKSQGDYWWHFKNIMELKQSCRDALGKIIDYGIPFLNDPDSKSPF